MKILAFIFSLLLLNKSSCQFNFRANYSAKKNIDFIGDSSKDLFLTDDDKTIKENFDSIYNIKKDYDFQFRLWEYGMSGTHSLFILSLKNRKFSVKYFEFYRSLPNYEIKAREKQVDSSKLDQLWDLMKQNDVLKLPSENSLREHPPTYYKLDTTTFRVDEFGRQMDVTDGLLFIFELFKPGKRKSYNYGCCNQSVLNANQTVGEYYKATAIILMIKKYLGYPVSSYLR